MSRGTLDLWRWFAAKPGGKWAFSRLLCLKAPYFGSIRPRFVELRPGHCEVRMRKRRAVLNHIGSVHAVATPRAQMDWSVPGEFQVDVVVRDRQDETVFEALITMWVAPRKASSDSA